MKTNKSEDLFLRTWHSVRHDSSTLGKDSFYDFSYLVDRTWGKEYDEMEVRMEVISAYVHATSTQRITKAPVLKIKEPKLTFAQLVSFAEEQLRKVKERKNECQLTMSQTV